MVRGKREKKTKKKGPLSKGGERVRGEFVTLLLVLSPHGTERGFCVKSYQIKSLCEQVDAGKITRE